MTLPSFHDDYVVGYEVECEARRIVLKIRSAQSQAISAVVFSGVAGYSFVNDAMGNIVLALEQVPAGEVVAEFRSEIAESFRMSGAPGAWAENLDAAGAKLQSQGVHGFVLSSSFGMSGWVLASHAEVVAQPSVPPDVPAAASRRQGRG